MKALNIDSTVKVRLTKYGKEVHRKNWEDFWSSINRLDENPYEPPNTDAGGYVEFEMWYLMDTFGSHCGKEQPFCGEILIDEDDLKEVEIDKEGKYWVADERS